MLWKAMPIRQASAPRSGSVQRMVPWERRWDQPAKKPAGGAVPPGGLAEYIEDWGLGYFRCVVAQAD